MKHIKSNNQFNMDYNDGFAEKTEQR